MTEISKTTFKDVAKKCDELRRYIVNSGINIKEGSVLDRIISSTLELPLIYEAQSIESESKAQEMLINGINAYFLSECILGVRGTSIEDQLISKLKYLCSGDPKPIGFSKTSSERNLLFELVCGCVINHFADEINFDEPDIIARHNDINWGVACKSLSGKPSTARSCFITTSGLL